MKNLKHLITGLPVIMAFLLFSPPAEAAAICNPNTIDTHYKGIYCGIQQDDSEGYDEELIKILSTQFGLKEELIEGILGNTICDTLSKYTEDEKADLPESIRDVCLPSGKSTEQVLGSWSFFTDIKNAYQKEKIIQQSSKSLEFKFKTSEQYWDGQIGTITEDAPFDLVVDLNLIEIVLFGSKATWMDDVFTFPSDKEEGGDGGTGQAPVDELLPKESTPAETTGPEDTGDQGLTVTTEEGELPPDCVLPDDPEADNGDGPGSGYQNPLCGNGTIDILVAEQCDDGNTKSGDGCNQYCQTEASGSNDQCTDPDAITFKKPDAGDAQVDGMSEPQCPSGSVPRVGAGISGQEAGPPKEIPQSPEYPGPFLGGTLKQFPASNRPPCGLGESAIQVTVAGKTHTAKNDEGNAICVPTELCADFNDARDFLFGDGWEDDEQLANIAPAIESLFCVNIIKADRPLSPYSLNEGCIDCHITAMADALEKALQTNVSPLKNTTNAFGISSPYGPNFSFNLNTAIKSKPKYNPTGTAANAIKKANESMAKSQNDNKPPASPANPSSPLAGLANTAAQAREASAAIMEDVHLSGLSNKVISDQEVGGRIKPLLEQMRDSFTHIQSTYEGIISFTALDEKKQCIK